SKRTFQLRREQRLRDAVNFRKVNGVVALDVLDFDDRNSAVLPVATLERVAGNDSAHVTKSAFVPLAAHASRISATLPAMVCSRSRAWAFKVSSSSFSVSSCSLKS